MEYYSNEIEDDIKNGIVGGLIEEPQSPNSDLEEKRIEGDTFIKVKKTYEYEFKGALTRLWSVVPAVDVTLIPCPTDPRKVSLKWNNSFSG
jgi:hypothetical protein